MRSWAKNWSGYKKIIGVTNQRHSANFRLNALKRIEHGLNILESMFYSLQNDWTTIGGVSLIRNTTIVSRQILKQWLTAAGRNFKNGSKSQNTQTDTQWREAL